MIDIKINHFENGNNLFLNLKSITEICIFDYYIKLLRFNIKIDYRIKLLRFRIKKKKKNSNYSLMRIISVRKYYTVKVESNIRVLVFRENY